MTSSPSNIAIHANMISTNMIMNENKGKKEVKEKKEKKEVKSGDECSVCCELYSLSTRKKIECPKCEYKCCKKCIETFLLSSLKTVPSCMQCDLEFSSSFVFDNTSKIFYRDKYIEKKALAVLIEQKNLLPATLVNYIKKKEMNKRKDEIKSEISILKAKITKLVAEYEMIKYNENTSVEIDDNNEKCQRPCPVNECKGYLLTAKSGRPFGSTAWKCGLCETWVCPDCGNVKGEKNDEEHVCNEDDKMTLVMLKKDTKSCPGCYKPIHKTEGCDQMFCVQCHTAFSWITGKKVNGVIHNPHYYEMQRAANGGIAPRVAGDNPCRDQETLPMWYQIVQQLPKNLGDDKFTKITSIPKIIELKLLDIHRSIAHNDDCLIRTTTNKLSETHKSTLYLKLREKYLDMSPSAQLKLSPSAQLKLSPSAQLKLSPGTVYNEENWLSSIKSDIKMCEKYKQMKMIYDLTKTILIEIFNKIFNKIDIYTCIEEMENIRKYSNQQLAKIYTNYGTKVYMYNEKYILE